VLVQAGCRRANTEEGVLIFQARSGVIVHLVTPVTGVRLTLMSAHQIRVRTKAPVLTTEDDLHVSV